MTAVGIAVDTLVDACDDLVASAAPQMFNVSETLGYQARERAIAEFLPIRFH